MNRNKTVQPAPQQQFRFNKVNTAPKNIVEQNGKRKIDNPAPLLPNPILNGEHKKLKTDESSNENSPNGQIAETKKHLQMLNDLTLFHKVKVKYDVINESGPQHAKTFQVKCSIYNPETNVELESYVASGTSISKAKQSAAEIALSQTKLEKPTAEQIKKKRSVKKHASKENQPNRPLSPLTKSRKSQQAEIELHKLNKRLLYDKHSQIEADKHHIELIIDQLKKFETTLLPMLGEHVEKVSPIGPFAKGLMLKTDKSVQLVVTLKSHPDYQTVKDLIDKLLQTDMFKKSENTESDKIYVDTSLLASEYCFYFTCRCDEFEAKFQVLFTSDDLAESKEIVEGNYLFPLDHCTKLNVALKQQQWFENRFKNAPNSLVVLKLLRDMCKRDPDWHLDDNLLELLVSICFQRKNTQDLNVKFREFFELIASGALLLSEMNIDCKYLGGVDSGEVFCLRDFEGNLVELERSRSENLSRLAQHALRLIAFRKIDALFAMSNNKTN